MRIVDASYEILEPYLQGLSIFERLEFCGRVCYKSEDKITDQSALPFCMKMIDNKHMATMEMAVVHMYVRIDGFSECTDEDESIIAYRVLQGAKYLIVSKDRDGVFVSGSIRAFYELFNTLWKEDFQTIYKCLNENYPEFFPVREIPDEVGDAEVYVMAQVDMPYKHRFMAVRFIVNRAVTHEIVRHRPVTYLQESQRYCRYSADKFGNEVTFINPKAFFDEAMDDSYRVWEQSCERAEKDYLQLLKMGNSPQAARTVLPNSCKTEIIVYTNMPEWEHIFSLRVPPSAEPSMREVMIPLQLDMFDRGYLKNLTVY